MLHMFEEDEEGPGIMGKHVLGLWNRCVKIRGLEGDISTHDDAPPAESGETSQTSNIDAWASYVKDRSISRTYGTARLIGSLLYEEKLRKASEGMKTIIAGMGKARSSMREKRFKAGEYLGLEVTYSRALSSDSRFAFMVHFHKRS